MAFFPDLVSLIGFDAVGGVPVLPGVDGDGFGVEFIGRAECADGDFAAVGDENLGELAVWHSFLSQR